MTPTTIQQARQWEGEKYSQQDEQRYILDALKDIDKGTLLDVGAWNAKTFSNSRALIEMGWKAMLVEPSPGPLNALLKEYGEQENVTIVSALVVAMPSVVSPFRRLHVSEDGVSTTEEAEYKKWRKHANFVGDLYLFGVNIYSLLLAGEHFDFVSIDTEGTSVDLLKDLMAVTKASQHRQPQCICVEHNDRQDEVYFATRGRYETIYANTENLVLKAV